MHLESLHLFSVEGLLVTRSPALTQVVHEKESLVERHRSTSWSIMLKIIHTFVRSTWLSPTGKPQHFNGVLLFLIMPADQL